MTVSIEQLEQWMKEPEGERLEFKRSGANGFIEIGDHELEIEIKLGMLLTPLKSTIETKINDYLDEALG